MASEAETKPGDVLEITEFLATLDSAGVANLRQSFEIVEKIAEPLDREYELAKAAKRFNLPITTYRQLLKIHSEKPRSLGERIWLWTGFRGKKLWDWLDLALIPIVLTSGAFLLNALASERDKQTATERYQQEQLSKYFDEMTELSPEENLLDSATQQMEQTERSQIIVQLRTLSTLRVLGSQEKGALIRFLYESELITCNTQNSNSCSSVLSLSGADLRAAYLYTADLSKSNLQGVDLTDADLSFSNLNNANLSNSKLYKVNMRGAGLRDTNFSNARFCEVIMPDGKLNNTDCNQVK